MWNETRCLKYKCLSRTEFYGGPERGGFVGGGASIYKVTEHMSGEEEVKELKEEKIKDREKDDNGGGNNGAWWWKPNADTWIKQDEPEVKKDNKKFTKGQGELLNSDSAKVKNEKASATTWYKKTADGGNEKEEEPTLKFLRDKKIYPDESMNKTSNYAAHSASSFTSTIAAVTSKALLAPPQPVGVAEPEDDEDMDWDGGEDSTHEETKSFSKHFEGTGAWKQRKGQEDPVHILTPSEKDYEK
jgi:hypothetical protein